MAKTDSTNFKTSLCVKAAEFAVKKHSGQLDDEGKDYFTAHCMHVFRILGEVTKDEEILASGLLHDILEDTDTTYVELELGFGKRVAALVFEVTHAGSKDNHGFYFPRLVSRDAILLKFADRLSNLSRMAAWGPRRQEQYLRKSKFWRSE